jgi:uncharacterized protein (DUF2236 family)
MQGLFPPAPALGAPGDPGLFGPDSAAWRLARERLLLAGGPAALLLQVAHPLVAAGVAEHSDFEQDPMRRLRGTLDATLTVTFGDSAQVEAAVAAVAARHRSVAGRLVDSSGSFAAGTPYRAGDPELAMWVFATLVWSAVRVVDTFQRPVLPDERDAYYADMREFGRRFRASEAAMPADFMGLEDYVQRTVREVLVVGPVALQLADQILAPDPPLVPAPLRPLPALIAAGLLPDSLRDAYQLPWRRRDRLAFGALRAATRPVVPVLPPALRYWPHYRTAVRRMRAADPARAR